MTVLAETYIYIHIIITRVHVDTTRNMYVRCVKIHNFLIFQIENFPIDRIVLRFWEEYGFSEIRPHHAIEREYKDHVNVRLKGIFSIIFFI